MNDVDKNVLISKIFVRNVIWDKRLKGNGIRHVVDTAWQEVAAEMGVENVKILRRKWTRLRDQFAVELGKFCTPFSDGSRPPPCTKWPYFKSLMFLLGIVKPRLRSIKYAETHALTPPESDPLTLQETDLLTVEESEDCQIVAHVRVPREELEPGEIEGNTEFHTTRCHSSMHLYGVSGNQSVQNGSTRYANSQKILFEERKAYMHGCICDDSEDALFFRSLLPHVNRIPQHLKLRFRHQVEQVVEKFIYPYNSFFAGPRTASY